MCLGPTFVIRDPLVCFAALFTLSSRHTHFEVLRSVFNKALIWCSAGLRTARRPLPRVNAPREGEGAPAANRDEGMGVEVSGAEGGGVVGDGEGGPARGKGR